MGLQEKRRLLKAARALYRKGLVSGTGGNLSILLPGGILITPTGVSFRDLTVDALCELSPEGRWEEGPRPSSEIQMHLRLLGLRPDIKAVCHIHGPYSTGLSILKDPGEDVLPPLTPGLVLMGPLAMLPQLCPGSSALAEAVMDSLKGPGKKAVLLQNHGLVTVGADIEEAVNIAEEIEEGARVWFLTRERPISISPDLAMEIRASYGPKKG